jgi:hypothetical protein
MMANADAALHRPTSTDIDAIVNFVLAKVLQSMPTPAVTGTQAPSTVPSTSVAVPPSHTHTTDFIVDLLREHANNATFNLTNVQLMDADLSFVNFTKCTLINTTFVRCALINAQFDKMSACTFENCILDNAIFFRSPLNTKMTPPHPIIIMN